MSLTFHDMFCGAGGSSEGARAAGAVPVIGMNHWRVACDSYEANHAAQGARAACVDVITQDPRRYPKADMLLASPECTHHSYARGKPKDDPSLFDPDGDKGAERSRATMWDVVRFAEVHQYRAIVCENVGAVVKWGFPKGHRYRPGTMGPLFRAWLMAMEGLDYEWKLVHLNSMICGVAQSRNRLYPVFWKRGQRAPDLDIPALCYCPECDGIVWGEQRLKRAEAVIADYGTQYVYSCQRCSSRCEPAVRPAAEIIDWSIEAPKIADRDRPLKPATIDRIRRGLAKLRDRPTYAQLPNGLVVQVGGNVSEHPGQTRAWPLDEPLRATTATNERALVLPYHGSDGSHRTRNAHTDELPALTAQRDVALVIPTTHDDGSDRARRANEQPLPTVTAANRSELALIVGMRMHGVPRDARTGPMQTVVTERGGVAIVVGLRGQEGRPGGAQDPKRVTEPLDTISAQGLHHALLIANYGRADGQGRGNGWSRHVDEGALGSITSSDSHALFTYRDETARMLAEPMVTATTINGHALVGDVTAEEIEQCTFRMLAAHELKAGSGFPDSYVLHGTATDHIAQVGNAVTPPAEEELVRRVIASLA